MLEWRPFKSKAVRASAIPQGARGSNVQVPRLIVRTHPAGILPRPVNARLVDAGLGQHNRRGQMIPAARMVNDLRWDRRPFIEAGGTVCDESGRKINPASQQHVAGFAMAVRSSGHGAHEGEAVTT